MTSLLDRIRSVHSEDASADFARLAELLILGNEAPAGSEKDIVSIAADAGLSKEKLAEMVQIAGELKTLLPTLGRRAATLERNQESIIALATANKRFADQLRALKEEVKRANIARSGAINGMDALSAAERRFKTIERDHRELAIAAIKNAGLTIDALFPPPPAPPPRPAAPIAATTTRPPKKAETDGSDESLCLPPEERITVPTAPISLNKTFVSLREQGRQVRERQLQSRGLRHSSDHSHPGLG